MNLDIVLTDQLQAMQLAKVLVTPQTAQYFHQTGLDAYAWMCAELGVPRGWRQRWALRQRTGESMPPEPSLEQLVQHVAQALSGTAGSRP